MTYRSDIDGLRAVSVISVVLFHLGFSFVPGGFIGVDVFFVISGFLITSLIVKDLEQDRFSLLDFYDRRIRRIFPAMLVVTAATLAAGFALALPGDYAAIGESAAFSALSVANVYFDLHTGYFDRTADLLPLIHMWSLAVEEQCYVVWPLLLAGFTLINRNWRRTALLLVLAIITVSFIASVLQVASDPKAAFFLPQYRAWELAAGAALAFVPQVSTLRFGAIAETVPLIGLGLLAYGFVHLSKDSAFPGANALWPVVGAALVLWPQTERTVIARALSTPPLVFVGRISYSLYLWHWPLIVFYRFYLANRMPDARETAILLVVMVLIAWASWALVEQTFRKRWWSQRRTVGAGVGAASIMAIMGVAITLGQGLPSRVPPSVAGMAGLDTMWEWTCPGGSVIAELAPEGYCSFGAPWKTAHRHAMLWGDSHAEHMAPLLDRVAREEGVAIVMLDTCPAMLGGTVRRFFPAMPAYNDYCSQTRNQGVGVLRDHPEIDLVILSASWSNLLPTLYEENPDQRGADVGRKLLTKSLNGLMSEIQRSGRDIVVLGDVPQWREDPVPCALAFYIKLLREGCDSSRAAISRSDFKTSVNASYSALRDAVMMHSEASFIPVGDLLCAEQTCAAYLNGEFLYRDASHIRRNLDQTTIDKLANLLGFRQIMSSSGSEATKGLGSRSLSQ